MKIPTFYFRTRDFDTGTKKLHSFKKDHSLTFHSLLDMSELKKTKPCQLSKKKSKQTVF